MGNPLRNRTVAYCHIKLALFLVVMFSGPLLQSRAASAETGVVTDTVLERFRTYTGPRTREAFAELFSLRADSVVRQQPPIALSDGKTAVMIAVKVVSADGTAPNFAVEGAKLLSLESTQQDEWLIKVLPPPGALHVSLLVINGPETNSFPLTVSPSLPQKFNASSEAFASYLDAADMAGPQYDVNGDGRRDYIDDYIYTANFLSSERESGRSLEARRARAMKRTLTQPAAP
jgi:hypothetical protein